MPAVTSLTATRPTGRSRTEGRNLRTPSGCKRLLWWARVLASQHRREFAPAENGCQVLECRHVAKASCECKSFVAGAHLVRRKRAFFEPYHLGNQGCS